MQAIPRAERGFHYSWLPTAEYRDRFGYLAYSQSSGTSISFRTTTDDRFVGSDHYPTIYDPGTGRLVHLPGEALEADQTFVTAIIHEHGTDYRRWETTVERTRGSFYWPEESGGSHTAAQSWLAVGS